MALLAERDKLIAQRAARRLPNRKNPSKPVKTVHLPAGQADRPGALLVWAREHEHELADAEPLFFSRECRGGQRRPLSRMHAWRIVKAATARAGVQVPALRDSAVGQAGQPAPVHPHHLFRHARVRQIVRSTRWLPLAQKQAGWARPQTAYLTMGDREAAELVARKRLVQTGRVLVRRQVVTETRTIQVAVTREELVVERLPPDRWSTDASMGSSAGSLDDELGRRLRELRPGEAIRLPLVEEEVVVEKRPVVVEEVTVGTRRVQERRQVSGTARRDEPHLERSDDATMRGQ